MTIKKLKVTLKGPLWRLEAFEIEGIDVLKRWQEDSSKNEGSVTVTDFNLSTDNLLDIFIKIGAPNRTVYQVVLSGNTKDPNMDIDYTQENIIVKKNGRLNIILSKNINDITK